MSAPTTDIRPLIGIAATRPLTGEEAEAAFDGEVLDRLLDLRCLVEDRRELDVVAEAVDVLQTEQAEVEVLELLAGTEPRIGRR